MAVYNEYKCFRAAILGAIIERDESPIPQSTSGAIFNITGGRVAITQIVGEVTTQIENQACNAKLIANPDTGSSVDICANLNIQAKEVGCLFGITGTNTDAMIGINAGALPCQIRPVIVNVGTIDLNCSASNTGKIKWSCTWVPWDDFATITAAEETTTTTAAPTTTTAGP